MSCRKATRLISESRDRTLTRTERVMLRWHLLCCRACRRYDRQLEGLRTALLALADRLDYGWPTGGPGLPADARDRIRTALREHG
jgi:hypothetical protein